MEIYYEKVMVLNLTEHSYILCDTTKYHKVMTDLIKPNDSNWSHWIRTDKIIVVPNHLHDYVTHHYAKLFI